MSPPPNSGSGRLSRRSLLKGAIGTAAGAAVVGGLSGCGTAFSAGLIGSELAPGTLTYWNLFGGGDGVRMQTMQAAYAAQQGGPELPAGGHLHLGQPVLHQGHPGHHRRRPARRRRLPPDQGEEPGPGGSADRDHRRHARPGRALPRRLQQHGLGDAEGRREVVRDPARHPPVRPLLQHGGLRQGRAAELRRLAEGDQGHRRLGAGAAGRQGGDRRVRRLGRHGQRAGHPVALVPVALLPAGRQHALAGRGRGEAHLQPGADPRHPALDAEAHHERADADDHRLRGLADADVHRPGRLLPAGRVGDHHGPEHRGSGLRHGAGARRSTTTRPSRPTRTRSSCRRWTAATTRCCAR